ncbi:prepilin peptidase [Cellulosimicrobium terreum]|uniref:Prepilin peptidase n=1 Tax=Cellulosimicrobium funkei TaxID=264251 RepID=A0A4Y8R6A0_9MICO|nr:prepilin peptidase [Cellulosimicrobium funkei]TGA78436.1 prepilin peptidase [Cellulosimicrobium terreum]
MGTTPSRRPRPGAPGRGPGGWSARAARGAGRSVVVGRVVGDARRRGRRRGRCAARRGRRAHPPPAGRDRGPDGGCRRRAARGRVARGGRRCAARPRARRRRPGLLRLRRAAALRLAHPPGLGFGDVKLAGTLGTPLAWLGWAELVAGLLLPFLLGGAWALGLVVSRRARRDTAVAFGPFMVLGAGVAAGWGQTTTGAVLGG